MKCKDCYWWSNKQNKCAMIICIKENQNESQEFINRNQKKEKSHN